MLNTKPASSPGEESLPTATANYLISRDTDYLTRSLKHSSREPLPVYKQLTKLVVPFISSNGEGSISG